MQQLNHFLELDVGPELMADAEALVSVPQTTGRHRTADPGQFQSADIDYLRGLGYVIDG
ncbi:MAG: hypothetical protein ACPG1A_02485 [Halioglobus sp.]